jgi:hypothetical protein
VPGKYDHLNREELARLLEARDRRDATRFGLVWEANEIERDAAVNSDFVALDLVRELGRPCHGRRRQPSTPGNRKRCASTSARPTSSTGRSPKAWPAASN